MSEDIPSEPEDHPCELCHGQMLFDDKTEQQIPKCPWCGNEFRFPFDPKYTEQDNERLKAEVVRLNANAAPSAVVDYPEDFDHD